MDDLPDRMREHGSLRRDSKDLLNAGAEEIERLARKLQETETNFSFISEDVLTNDLDEILYDVTNNYRSYIIELKSGRKVLLEPIRKPS